MSTVNNSTTSNLDSLTAEVSQTLCGYKRNPNSLALLATIDDTAWARQAQQMIDAQRMRFLNALSPEALAAIASGDVSVSYIAGGIANTMG